MKIKINQSETYDIEIPEEVTMEQFMGLQQRFNHISKVLCKDTFGVLSTGKIPEVRGTRGPYKVRNAMHPLSERPWCESRDELIKVLKILYHSNKQAKYEYAESINRPWNDISKALPNYRKKWNIKPEEVGLIRFPYKGEGQGWRNKNLKIKQEESEEENKYDVGVKHFSKDGKYLCNQAVNPSEEKLTNEWFKVTCDNCKARRFKNADTEEEKEEDS